MVRVLISVCLVLSSSAPALAQTPSRPANAEGPAVGLFAGPGIDGSDPWFFTGVRISLPAGRRVSLDIESSQLLGGENEYARIHGWWSARLRWLKSPAERESRYWIAGVAVLPGDKLMPNGAIREQRLYSALVAGIGARRLMAGGLRVAGELSAHAGSGLGVRGIVAVQWGKHRR